MTEVDSLGAVATRLEISGLLAHYAYCLDTFQIARMAKEIFTPDGIDNHGMGEWVGRDAIREAFEKTQAPYVATAHVFSNERIEVSGDSATCSSYLTGWHWLKRDLPPVRPADFVIVGIYLDRLVQTREGWRVAHRRFKNLGPSALGVGQLPDSLHPPT